MFCWEGELETDKEVEADLRDCVTWRMTEGESPPPSDQSMVSVTAGPLESAVASEVRRTEGEPKRILEALGLEIPERLSPDRLL